VEGADLLGELVLDAPALAVAFDQLLGGELLLVGEDQGWLIAAELDGELAEDAAFDRDRVVVVAGGLVFAGAVQAGLGPGAGRERLERLD
jgi:hypothetical protein